MNKKLLILVVCFLTFSFANAQLNSVAMVGDGAGGWPANTPGEVDAHQMTTTDGVNWTLNNLTLTAGSIKFRGNNSWALPYNWGGTTFPNGSASVDGAGITSSAGIYNVSFNSTTFAYSFVLVQVVVVPNPTSVAIVGDGAGGWPANTPNEIDAHQMTSSDGENWSISNLALTVGSVKFRGNNSWALPYNWGGTTFPNGTAIVDGGGITSAAGIYNVSFNSKTGVYTFTNTSLGVNDFDTVSFIAYPNPTENNWTFSSPEENIESIVITNIAGQTIKTITPKSNQANIDASGLTAGLYFAKIITAAGSQTLKLVKQ